jgi:hypothetical protein
MSEKLTVQKKQLPSVIDFSADAGEGLEGADKESFAIPFIAVLQGLSPQLETVEGAKIGTFINTITNHMSAAVNVVPVSFQRRYLEWQPRDEGGGFRGSHEVVAIEMDKSIVRNEDGQLISKDGNFLKDTRIHYVLVVEDDGSFSPAIISLSSTQIKKSKRWLSRIQNIQMKDSQGRLYNPPSFSHIYRITSVKESNDSGAWYGYDINMLKPVEDQTLYAAAKMLHSQVIAGSITASAPPSEDKF